MGLLGNSNPWLDGANEASGIAGALGTVLMRVPQIKAQIAAQQQQAALADAQFGLEQQKFAEQQGQFTQSMGLDKEKFGLTKERQPYEIDALKAGAEHTRAATSQTQNTLRLSDLAENAVRRGVRPNPGDMTPSLENSQNMNLADLGAAAAGMAKDPNELISAFTRMQALQQNQGQQFDPRMLNTLLSGHVMPETSLHNVRPGDSVISPNDPSKVLFTAPGERFASHDPLPGAANLVGRVVGNPLADPETSVYQLATNAFPGILQEQMRRAGITNQAPAQKSIKYIRDPKTKKLVPVAQ